MRVVDIVIGVGWVIFWVGWFAASAGAKRGQRGRGNWARFAGVRVVLILVVVLLVRLRVLNGHGVGYVRDPVLWGVGLAIWVLGLGLAVWARIYLGRNWGMPTSTKEDPELVTSGPYRTIRHPIYTGILLAMIGSAIAVGVWWLIAVALIWYFIYSAFVEERNMTRLFPSAYPEYQQLTKMRSPLSSEDARRVLAGWAATSTSSGSGIPEGGAYGHSFMIGDTWRLLNTAVYAFDRTPRSNRSDTDHSPSNRPPVISSLVPPGEYWYGLSEAVTARASFLGACQNASKPATAIISSPITRKPRHDSPQRDIQPHEPSRQHEARLQIRPAMTHVR